VFGREPAILHALPLRIAVGVILAIAAALNCLGSGPATAASDKPDPRLVWPKNSRFTCSGVLVHDDGYALKPDDDMLTWCSADIDDKDEGRVLGACKAGGRCEIKGTIAGHGTFSWTAISSVKALP
jgi:hypothetical protein